MSADVIFITAVCAASVTQFRKDQSEPINAYVLAYFLSIDFESAANGASSNVNKVGLRGY